MQRAILPFVLASLGLVLIMWTRSMPLFEWKITEIKSDFADNYEVHVAGSPWISELGESLDDRNYYFHMVSVSNDQNACMNIEELINIESSPNHKNLESISTKFHGRLSQLILVALVIIILSGLYFWWITVQLEHRSIPKAIISSAIAMILLCLLLGILKILTPGIAADYFLVSWECRGQLVLRAELSKIHYEMPTTMGLAILGEVGALGIMLHRLVKTMIQRIGS